MSSTTEDKRDETVSGDEEFNPTGTVAVLSLYFMLLVFLWFFMYFVEFVGRGPTVLGS